MAQDSEDETLIPKEDQSAVGRALIEAAKKDPRWVVKSKEKS